MIKEPLSRKKDNKMQRRDFSKLLSQACGLSFILWACKTTAKKSGPTPTPISAPTPSKTEQDISPISQVEETISTPQETKPECVGYKTNFNIDLSQISVISEDLTPDLRFYGKDQLCLVCLQLPKYQDQGLQTIYLTRANGDPICQKPITNNDFLRNKTLRTQIIDCLPLQVGEKIAVVFKRREKYYKYENITVDFVEKFRGKKVISYASHLAAPSLSLSVVRLDIAPQLEDTTIENMDPQLKVYTMTSDHAWQKSKSLKDCIITDVMGKVLSEDGEEFTAFLSHPLFVCYKPYGDFYVRSILKIN
jgi:hypothetical protein